MYKVSLLVPPESHRSKMSSTVCSRWKTSFLLWSSSFLETRARLNYIHYLGAIKPGNRWQMDKSSKGKRSSCSFVAVSQFGGIYSSFRLGLMLIVSKLWRFQITLLHRKMLLYQYFPWRDFSRCYPTASQPSEPHSVITPPSEGETPPSIRGPGWQK